jgi:mannose-6-phosphate isomerase-like protein (cupin superfamily)
MAAQHHREQLNKEISVAHRIDCSPGAVHTCHMHDAPEVLLVVQGRLTVTVNDMTLYTGSFVANGQWWTDPVAAATIPIALEDIGAGG